MKRELMLKQVPLGKWYRDYFWGNTTFGRKKIQHLLVPSIWHLPSCGVLPQLLFVSLTVPGKQNGPIRFLAHNIAVNNDSFYRSRLLFEVDRNKANCKVIITWKEIMLDWDSRVLHDCHKVGSRCTGVVWQKYCQSSPRNSPEVSWEFMGTYIVIMMYSPATWNTSTTSHQFPCRQKMSPE